MNAYRKAAVMAASLALAWSVPGMAQNSPFVPGDYVEVASITIDDGGGHFASSSERNDENNKLFRIEFFCFVFFAALSFIVALVSGYYYSY